MRIRKKTFAGVIFAVAFVMMVGISALALWTNDVVSFDNIKPTDQDMTAADTTLYPFVDNNDMWGYKNAGGDVVVDAKYEKVDLFQGSIAWVKKDGLWGAVNMKGQQVIDCVYPVVYQPDDKIYKIWVAADGNSQSVYNDKGQKIFGVDNGNIGHVDGGLIAFSRAINGIQHWGYIDTMGKVVVAPVYKSVGDVGLTHAIVQNDYDEKILVKRADGTETLLPDNVDMQGLGSNRLLFYSDQKYGYLDMDGNAAIEAQFVWADAFNNGLALVRTEKGYGLIDEQGDYVVQAKYKYAENIGNGYYMFGDSAVGKKTIYNKNGDAVIENVIRSNDWFGGYLNIETENETRFIRAGNGLVDNVSMKPNCNVFYYGSRICLQNAEGVAYYDTNGNLIEEYGKTAEAGENCRIATVWESPDVYLEIAYPEITASSSSLQKSFAEISKRLKENALSDYAQLYKDSDGSINYMVTGSFEYSVCGSLVTVLQKTTLVDEEEDYEYDSLCFDTKTGEMYSIGSLFAVDFNWRTDLKDLLVGVYKKQNTNLSTSVKEDVIETLSKKLDRNIGFLLEEDGVKLYIACDSTSETLFLSYEELEPFVDTESELWQNIQKSNRQ